MSYGNSNRPDCPVCGAMPSFAVCTHPFHANCRRGPGIGQALLKAKQGRLRVRDIEQVLPQHRSALVQLLARQKLEPSQIIYPWHRRWWRSVLSWWQGRDVE